MYRVCKEFEFQAAHVLSKHKGKCKYPHGHSYRIAVTLSAEQLDENDMVCDFHIISMIVKKFLDKLDHTIMLNSEDNINCKRNENNERLVVLKGQDPTSEVLAKLIFEHISDALKGRNVWKIGEIEYNLNPCVKIERVRVWETSSAWAEYVKDD